MNLSHIANMSSCLAWSMLSVLSMWLVSGMAHAQEEIKLPQDPATPVVELWYVDHGRVTRPEVAVYAGGRVQVRVGEGSLWGEIGREQVLLLVRDLLQQDDLAHLKTEVIQQEVNSESLRTGLSCQIRDAGDTIIRVRTATALYRVDGHAVGLLSNRFPGVECLQRLNSAQRRLENVRAVVMVGGIPAAQRLAQMAQQQVLAESGEEIPVGLENLSCVHSLTDGTRCCQFVVPTGNQPGSTSARIISLFESPGETPRVSVLPDGPAIQ